MIIHFRKEGAGCYINMTLFVEGLVIVRKELNKLFNSKKIHISRKYSVIPTVPILDDPRKNHFCITGDPFFEDLFSCKKSDILTA